VHHIFWGEPHRNASLPRFPFPNPNLVTISFHIAVCLIFDCLIAAECGHSCRVRPNTDRNRQQSKAMVRTKQGVRRRICLINNWQLRDQFVYHRPHMEHLKIQRWSRHVLYAALVKWCKHGCPKKFARNVGENITREEAHQLACKIGHEFWGLRSPHVMRNRGIRELGWPRIKFRYA
jgi:hypothetical protein